MNKDCMLDIETLGLETDAAIVSIGACFFNIETGEVSASFYSEVNLQSSLDAGLRMDANTVLWWLKQTKEAQEVFRNNDKAPPLLKVLDDLSTFIVSHAEDDIKDVKIWANSPIFDNIIVETAFKKCGLTKPWHYSGDRCVRTILHLGKEILGINTRTQVPFEGTRHNAASDAAHQAKCVSVVYSAFKKLKDTNENPL